VAGSRDEDEFPLDCVDDVDYALDFPKVLCEQIENIRGVDSMNAPARIVRLRTDAQVSMACEDNLDFMRRLESNSIKLIVTSPPYNIGKTYERRDSLENYVKTQTQVI